jgi:glycosyltransferase involved in cell wall biosynthesis
MHILICAVSSARHPTGICRHAANLSRCMAECDEVSQVSLLVGAWQADYFRSAFDLRHAKLEMTAVSLSKGALSRNYWYLRGLPAVARACSPDLVHLSFPVPVVRDRFPCPVVLSLHDVYPFDIPENFGLSRAIFNRRFLRQSLRNCDAVVCSSDFTLDRLWTLSPETARGKAIRIYQCVDMDDTANHEPPRPEIKGGPFLLAVAQHRRNKNLLLLVSAFAELQSRSGFCKSMRLLIVGSEGPETPRLRQKVAQLSLGEKVTFMASLADSEMRWLYRNCELFIATSTIEGFGLPVAEALQCGACVVCSDIPAFREIAGAACCYFNLETTSPASTLADAVLLALQESTNKPAILDRFAARAISTQYVSLYSRLLNVSLRGASTQTSMLPNQVVPYDEFAG